MSCPLRSAVKWHLHFTGTGERDTFTNENFLRKCKFPLQKGQLYSVFRAFPVSAVPQLPSAQNNPYAKVVYLGVAYSVPLVLFPLCATSIRELQSRKVDCLLGRGLLEWHFSVLLYSVSDSRRLFFSYV